MKKYIAAIFIVLVTIGLVSGVFFLSGSHGRKLCEQLHEAVKNPRYASYLRSWMMGVTSDTEFLSALADLGGDVSSYELPKKFKELDVSFEWSNIGIKHHGMYISIEGDWWGKSGLTDISNISAVSLGLSRRQFITIKIKDESFEIRNVDGNIIPPAYEEDGFLIYCQ